MHWNIALGVLSVGCAILAFGVGARADRPKRIRLRADQIEKSWLIPLSAELQVSGTSFQVGSSPARERLRTILEGRVGSPNDAGKLPVDAAGTGSRRWLSPRKEHVVTFQVGDASHPLLFYVKQDVWHVASASIVRARVEKRTIQLYDADLDGVFLSPHDYLRVEPGAFRPVASDPLVLIRSGLRLLSIDASSKYLTATAVPRPAWANDGQWDAILAVSRFRSAAGLPLMRLDERKSQGCQLHAAYLKVNKDAPETPVDISHNEVEGNPGYSKLGQEAARACGIHYTTDLPYAIVDLLKTLLHRSNFVGEASRGFGAGVEMGSLGGGVAGYAVLWGADPEIRSDGMPILIPGAGQTDFPRQGESEIPDVEKYPGLFRTPRGNPIAVYCGGLPFSNIRMDVFRCHGRKRVALKGITFTQEDPVTSMRKRNDDAAFFVAESALEGGTRYEARFTADLVEAGGKTRAIQCTWMFQTKQ